MDDQDTLSALAALMGPDNGQGTGTPGYDPDLASVRPAPMLGTELEDPNAEPEIDWAAVPAHPSFDPAAEEAELGPPLPQSQGSSSTVATDVSAGMSGYSATKNAQIAKGPGSRLERKIQADRDAIEARYAPIREAQVQARAYEQQAADKVIAAEQDRITEMARSKGEMAHLFNEFKNKEEKAMQQAIVSAEAAKADYRTALADFGATNINPGQLWSRMDSGDQFAMGVNAFVHDYLQAGGIKSSSMEIFNKGVDRNISAQIENLNTKGKVAAGFKDLWEMQRMQSATDTEARARIRGFALDSALKQVESQMGQYDSRLAGAKGMAAKAEIMKEMVKNDYEVMQHIDKAANDAAMRQVQAYGDELRASTASAQMRSAERISAADNTSREKIAAGNVKPAAPGAEFEGVIADVSATGDTTVTRKFLAGTPPGEQTRIRTKAALMTGIAEGMAELQKLQARAGARPDLVGDTRFMDEVKRTSVALERYLQLGLAYARSGKAINETEIKFTGDFFKDDTWLTNGDNVPKLATIMGRLIKETNLEIESNSYGIGPDDPAYGKKLGRASFIAGLEAQSDIDASADKGRVQATESDKAHGKLSTPDAAKPADRATTSAPTSARWTKYLEFTGGLSNDDKRARMGNDGVGGSLSDNAAAASDSGTPDVAFAELSRLYELSQTDPTAKQYFDDALDNTIKAAKYTNADPGNPDHWHQVLDPSEQTPEALKLHEYAKFITDLEAGKPMSNEEAFLQGTRKQ